MAGSVFSMLIDVMCTIYSSAVRGLWIQILHKNKRFAENSTKQLFNIKTDRIDIFVC